VTKIRSRAPEEPADDKTRALLARRSERLRAPLPADSELRAEWVAELAIGEDRYAIALSALRAVVPLRLVTPVPLSRPHVIGLLRFGGQIITALSLASLLGIRGWAQDPAVLIVVDPGFGGLVALDCEDVPRPIAVAARALEEARGRGKLADFVHEGRVLHVIDLARLLDRRSEARDGQ
jgi:chemotaxis signal transduction protein